MLHHIEHVLDTLMYVMPIMGAAKWVGVTAWRWMDERHRAHRVGA